MAAVKTTRRSRPVPAARARNADSKPKLPRAVSTGQWNTLYDHLVLILVMVLAVLWATRILPDAMISDEGFHWPQIGIFMNGGYFTSHISTLPGYHLTIAHLMQLLSLGGSLPAARVLTWLISVPGVVCFYLIARKSGEGNPSALTLQLYLLPIIFPFFFTIHTDAPSLSLVLIALLLTLNRNYRLGALVAGVSMVFRQTNVVWLFLFWLLALSELGFFSALRGFTGFRNLKYRELLDPLRRTYLFPVFCLVFVAYVLTNKGVAAGDVSAHYLGRIYPTQIFLLLSVLFFLFLPLHIRNVPAIWRMLKAKPVLLFAGALLYGFYMATFYADHGYNYIDYYLRNLVLNWLREGMLNQSLLFISILWAFYSLLVTPLRRKKYYWFYPVVVLYLLPIELIEPRYYIVPVALFILFRKPIDDRREYLTAATYIPMTMYVFMGTAAKSFFL